MKTKILSLAIIFFIAASLGFAALADEEEKAPISCTALFKYDRNILIDGLFFPYFME